MSGRPRHVVVNPSLPGEPNLKVRITVDPDDAGSLWFRCRGFTVEIRSVASDRWGYRLYAADPRVRPTTTAHHALAATLTDDHAAITAAVRWILHQRGALA